MELDEFKSQINDKLSTDHSERSEEDIAALLTNKTSSVIGKLKRSLWIEIGCCILVIVSFGYIGIAGSYHALRVYFSVFAVLAVAFLFLIIYLLRRISQLSSSSLPVKVNLQTIVNIIEVFMKRYFQFTMMLFPVCFIFAIFLGHSETSGAPVIEKFSQLHFPGTWWVIVLSIAYVLLVGVFIYYFTKWYLTKLYGRYIEQLKQCIEELSQD